MMAGQNYGSFDYFSSLFRRIRIVNGPLKSAKKPDSLQFRTKPSHLESDLADPKVSPTFHSSTAKDGRKGKEGTRARVKRSGEHETA